ncbi:MAG: hypothetical protein ABSD09_13965 [Xanthobacteraceae bacterium]|jgi:hypothetical protein
MTLRSIQLRIAAAILALGAIALAGPSARAFTMENLSAGSDANSRYADPDGQVKNGMTLFGQNGPTVQFGAGSAYSPLNRTPYSGFAPSQPPPEPYSLNNRN